MEKTESYGKDVEKTKQVELVRFQKKLCEVFTRPFSQMGAPFIVVHVVHPLGRSMPDGGLKASPSLRNSSMSVGHSEAIFHMESQCHVLLLETV